MATATTQKQLHIENVGPIENLSIPIPEEGGVVVLRGRNGCGKTHALNAAASLCRGSGILPVADGAVRGTVEGLGAKITVGRATRRTGEVEVEHLEGRLDISDMIDPGFKNPEAADAKRIKALVSLTGVTAAPDLFTSLVPASDWAEYVGPNSTKTDDLVEMAGRIKRDFEAAARKLEGMAEKSDGEALGLRESAGEPTKALVALAKCTPASLSEILEGAVRVESALKQAKASAEKRATEIATAKTTLANLGSLEEAKQHEADTAKALATAQEEWEACQMAKIEADHAYQAAKKAVENAADRCIDAKKSADAASRNARQVESMAALITGDLAEAPDENELAIATANVAKSRQRIEEAAVARKAIQDLQAAERATLTANTLRKRSADLRDAAKATDEVLSKAVSGGSALRVEAGRLVTDTVRGSTYYHELSDGERARIAIDICATRLDSAGGRDGFVIVQQSIWEGLDPDNRSDIAAHAREHGVAILTAEAADGELRAEEVV